MPVRRVTTTQDRKDGSLDQLVGLCTMLAVLERHLPDEVLVGAVVAVGGPRVFAETLIRVQSGLPGEDTSLLDAASNAMTRVRAHLSQGLTV